MPTVSFPLDIVRKINSPELLAILQQYGHQVYADAEDINLIIDAIDQLASEIGYGVTPRNNIVNVLTIYENELSGTGTIEEQICEFVLSLPELQRTIDQSFSKWNIVVKQGSASSSRIHTSTFSNAFN